MRATFDLTLVASMHIHTRLPCGACYYTAIVCTHHGNSVGIDVEARNKTVDAHIYIMRSRRIDNFTGVLITRIYLDFQLVGKPKANSPAFTAMMHLPNKCTKMMQGRVKAVYLRTWHPTNCTRCRGCQFLFQK